jgi:cyclic pyranopterin phosphate synthase
VNYLRVSVTDRCDFRCTYCMAENMTFLPKKDLLTLEELDRLCTVFIEKGVRRIRLTGGEPLVRKNIMDSVEQVGRHIDAGRMDELTLTTNGSQLTKHASELDCTAFAASTSRSTRSIPTSSREITRWGDLGKRSRRRSRRRRTPA